MKTTYLLPFYAFLTFSLRAEFPRSEVREVQPIGHLSLDDVTRVVLENNPAIKEAGHRWRAAIQRVRQAHAWTTRASLAKRAPAGLSIFRRTRSQIKRLPSSN